MDCSQPPALTEDQISAALDDGPDSAVAAHLDQCADCAARYQAAQQLEQTLKARLYRYDCPSAQLLADDQLGLFEPHLADAIGTHLRSCPTCSAERAELRHFIADQHPAKPLAPALTWMPAVSSRSIRAQLVPSAPGGALRGTANEPIMVEAGEHTIFLSLRPEGAQAMNLTGQLLAQPEEPWRGGLVEVRQAGAVRYIGPIDEHGGFQCNLPGRDPVDLRLVAAGEPAILIAAPGLPATDNR